MTPRSLLLKSNYFKPGAMWWHMPSIPVLGRKRQGDTKFKVKMTTTTTGFTILLGSINHGQQHFIVLWLVTVDWGLQCCLGWSWSPTLKHTSCHSPQVLKLQAWISMAGSPRAKKSSDDWMSYSYPEVLQLYLTPSHGKSYFGLKA